MPSVAQQNILRHPITRAVQVATSQLDDGVSTLLTLPAGTTGRILACHISGSIAGSYEVEGATTGTLLATHCPADGNADFSYNPAGWGDATTAGEIIRVKNTTGSTADVAVTIVVALLT